MPFYLYSVVSPTLPGNNISAVTNVSSLWSTCEMNIYSFFKNNLGPKQGDKGGVMKWVSLHRQLSENRTLPYSRSLI